MKFRYKARDQSGKVREGTLEAESRAEALAALAKRHFPQVTACDSVEQALRLARGDAPEGLVVCGSLYLAAQARGLLTK